MPASKGDIGLESKISMTLLSVWVGRTWKDITFLLSAAPKEAFHTLPIYQNINFLFKVRPRNECLQIEINVRSAEMFNRDIYFRPSPSAPND